MGSPIIWFGSAAKNLKEKFVYKESGVATGTFSASNNQASAADVDNLTFNGTRGGTAHVTIAIDATADLYEAYTLTAINKGGSWELAQQSVGDNSNVTFSITSAGQIQYTSGNESGFVSSTIKFHIIFMNS